MFLTTEEPRVEFDSMETPRTSAVESVYDPAEDSFLLIDALEIDLDRIRELKPSICLEIGCGSGVVISALAKCVENCTFLATDVNPIAAEAAKFTAQRHLPEQKTCVQTAVADLDSCFLGRLDSKVDLLVCNPPYVPTTETEALPDDATKLAWAGGPQGTDLVKRLLPRASELLSHRGCFYLLLLKENNPSDVCSEARRLGLEGRKVIERRCRNEHLFVYCFSRSDKTVKLA
ncbi:methyltransferase N6AMT1 [Galendromus occidentalis]|uniref:Methyltransferase HEMK2 n=1 Tax=Galendromus occidentalis TaxID=34638 RepID=A0AAJ6QLU0_9ACAR|nr:methyltransferase N6AMT1 [Galendromus occidentalis]